MSKAIEKTGRIATADNTAYTAHFVHPNSALGGTSFMLRTLYAIAEKVIRAVDIISHNLV